MLEHEVIKETDGALTAIKETKQPFLEKLQTFILPVSIIVGAALLSGVLVYSAESKSNKVNVRASVTKTTQSVPLEVTMPKDGVTLPVVWGDLGAQLIAAGVIDKKKFDTLYEDRGGLTEESRKLVYGVGNENIVITPQNAAVILNLLWALGLGTKNDILENGPMVDPHYGGAKNFASTGGWTLANGNAMDHYSKHSFIVLTKEQQALVENVSKNIYRPCCNNSTYFPDCNHGMAMLGLLELMASQGVSEHNMYKVALEVNSYWFPDTYQTIATYVQAQGIAWKSADPKEILGKNFSSSAGYKRILSEVAPSGQGGGGAGCSA